MGARRLLGTLGLIALCAAWGLLLFGLFGLPASDDPMVDLEAGPSFAVNLEVYLPAVLLTGVLLLRVLSLLLLLGRSTVAAAPRARLTDTAIPRS